MRDPIGLYYDSVRADLDEFGSLFANFRRSAYRLEMLPSYSVSEEKEALRLFLNGETQPPAGLNAEWLGMLKAAQGNGKTFSRTRLISTITPYIRFEVLWGYTESIHHGELINIIKTDQLAEIAAKVPILNDFWLFDESIGYLMEYDLVGRFLGVLKIAEDALSDYVTLMKELSGEGIDVGTAARELAFRK